LLRDHGAGLLIALPSHSSRPVSFSGKGLLNSVVLIPMICRVRRGDRHQADLRTVRRAQPLIAHLGLGRTAGRSTGLPEPVLGRRLVEALALYPIIISAVAALANVDPAMEEAAQNPAAPASALLEITCAHQPGLSPAARLFSSGHSPSWARRWSSTTAVTACKLLRVEGHRGIRFRMRWSHDARELIAL